MSNNVEVETGAVLVIAKDGSREELTSPVKNLKVTEGMTVYVGSGATVKELYAGIDYGTAGGVVHVYENAAVSGVWLQGGAEYYDHGGIYKDGSGPEGGWGGYGGAILSTSSSIILDGGEFSGNEVDSLSWSSCGGAVETYGGSLSVKNCRFEKNRAGVIENEDAGAGGALCVIVADTETLISDSVFSANSAYYGGAIQQNGGTMTINGAEFTGNTAARGGALQIHSGSGVAYARISNTVFHGNNASLWGGAIEIIANSQVTVSGITLKTATDTIQNFGNLIVSGKNLINAEVISTGSVVFDMTEHSAEYALIDNLGKFSGGRYELRLGSVIESGSYTLASNAAGFSGLLTLTVGNAQVGRFLIDDGAVAGNTFFRSGGMEYTLLKSGSALTVKVAASAAVQDSLTVESGIIRLSFADDGGAKNLTLSRNGAVAGFAMLSRSAQVYGWNGDWTCSTGDLSAGGSAATPESPVKFTAETDGIADIFFARAFGKWGFGYIARNTNTDETVFITGKNRFEDAFAGAKDANVLMLTDDAGGDVLFLDDIYSANGEAVRLGKLNEIRSGSGNDVIDLTSTRYTADLEDLVARGGEGDDVLWGSQCSQTLIGDAGNDIVSGGSGSDIICGGSGNDRLSGGGGDDIFCFGKDWGTDTLDQIAGGTVTLVFESGMEVAWNSTGDAVVCGGNTITFSSVYDYKISVFTGSEYLDYDRLAAQGCFADSHKSVFSESPDGVLAVL